MWRLATSLVVVCMCAPAVVSAQVLISEIMYDVQGTDTDREWIEIFNAGSSSVHITDWKLFEANTNHGIVAVSGGENLASGAYAVIADNPAKFLLDWPTFSGILLDSTFSLSNTGETLEIHAPPDLTVSDTISYGSASGAAGDGNSLHRGSVSGTTFAAATPTPGSGSLVAAQSSSSGVQSSATEAGSTQTSSQSSVVVSSYVAPIEPSIFAYAGKDRDVIAGADVIFRGEAYDKKGNQLDDSDKVRFLWTFGDGATAEGMSVMHHFAEPGRYAVILSIAQAVNAADAQIVVTARPVSITLSLANGSIVLTNTSGRNLDLSNWHLRSMGSYFKLPEHSVLLAGAAIPFSQEVTHLVASSDSALLYPSGIVAALAGQGRTTAPASSADPISTVVAEQVLKTAYVQPKTPAATDGETDSDAGDLDTSLASDTAGAELAAAAVPGAGRWWWLGAFGLAGLGAGGTYVLRRVRKGEWNIEEMTE